MEIWRLGKLRISGPVRRGAERCVIIRMRHSVVPELEVPALLRLVAVAQILEVLQLCAILLRINAAFITY